LNFDALTSAYWERQQNRVAEMASQLRSRSLTKEGRDFPDPDLTSSLAIGEGRRLTACVMFLDICGFSDRPMETQVEQDLMLRVLALFFSEMIRIAEEYEGHVEKNTGDGLLIYFSDDSGLGAVSAVQKALACSLTMQAATTHLINPVIVASKSAAIHFRISMDYGYITVAKIGAASRFWAHTAIGSTANFASKMLKHAGKDQIILGDSAKDKLPLEWQILWTQVLPINTGWMYRASGQQYPIHLYIGRWNKLV
jgi:class 3 adenylate cyclase